MKLYLLRHAIAGERDSKKYPDDSKRPLTAEGRRKMVRAARGMKAIGLRFDLILTSPFTRAYETAEIVKNIFPSSPPLKIHPKLAPGGTTEEILEKIPTSGRYRRVLLVGHEPDLSCILGELLLHTQMAFPLDFKKGGLCRIDFDSALRPGNGKLIFYLPPKILRALAPLKRT